VLLHSGDFTANGWPDQIEHFNRFLGGLPHQYKIVIAGNHELSFDVHNWSEISSRFPFPLEANPAYCRSLLTDCIYHEESSCEILGYKIWGTPWTPTYHD